MTSLWPHFGLQMTVEMSKSYFFKYCFVGVQIYIGFLGQGFQNSISFELLPLRDHILASK